MAILAGASLAAPALAQTATDASQIRRVYTGSDGATQYYRLDCPGDAMAVLVAHTSVVGESTSALPQATLCYNQPGTGAVCEENADLDETMVKACAAASGQTR